MAALKQGSGVSAGEDDKEKMLSAIVESLARSRENESWGLMVEAAEDYQKYSGINSVFSQLVYIWVVYIWMCV